MLERDYILRLFQMLGQAVSRIVFFKETKDYAEALAEVNKAVPAVLGLNMEMIELMPASGMKDLLGSDPALLHSKMYAAGALLKEKAEILGLQEKTDESAVLYMKSLGFLMDDVAVLANREDDKEIRTIDYVLDKLREFEIPTETKKKIVLYQEVIGRYDKAENMIFEILDEDAGYLNDGISFYKRLLLKPDADLESGGLPRKEVDESLAELQDRLGK